MVAPRSFRGSGAAVLLIFLSVIGALSKPAVAISEASSGGHDDPGGSDPLGDSANHVSIGDVPVRVQMDDIAFHTVFRAVPGVLGYNHMAMAEWIPSSKRIVIAWQAARSSEGSSSQVLFTSYSDDMGSTWNEPLELQRDQSAAPGVLWSPVLHYIPEKEELLLFYSESVSCLRPPKMRDGQIVGEPRWNPGGDIKVVTSYDAGNTWVNSRMVYPQIADGGIPKVIANRVHVLERNGGTTRLLLPFWRERARGAQVTEDCPTLTGGGHETSGVMISDDLGESWFPAGRIADPQGKTWLIEGTVATAGAGQLVMLLRSTTDVVWASRSLDEGMSWSVPEPLKLPNPNSKLSVLDLPNFGGTLISALNYHPRLRGEHSRTRSQLSLVTSVDQGVTWELIARLQAEMTPGNWYHYPTLLHISPRVVLVAYSTQHTADNTDGIRLAVVTLKRAANTSRRLSTEIPNAYGPAGAPGRDGLLTIGEGQFSASSTHSHCSVSGATLYGQLSWCASVNDSNQWLQVDLGQARNVTHVLTGGRLDSRSDQRVTAYAISFTVNGWKWEWYRGLMQDMTGLQELVLTGNTYRGGVQINELIGPHGLTGIMAKALRLHPVRWVNHISLQVALKVGDQPEKPAALHDEL